MIIDSLQITIEQLKELTEAYKKQHPDDKTAEELLNVFPKKEAD